MCISFNLFCFSFLILRFRLRLRLRIVYETLYICWWIQNNDIRRASLRRGSLRKGSLRRGSLRRGSTLPQTQVDLPWDILDRLLLPILCCHAAAITISGLLNVLRVSQVSTFALFAWFALSTGGAILFYHHLKVNCNFSIC